MDICHRMERRKCFVMDKVSPASSVFQVISKESSFMFFDDNNCEDYGVLVTATM